MRHSYKIALRMLLCLLAPCAAMPQSVPYPDRAFSLELGPENPLLTTAQRASLGFEFGPPDGTLGVLRLHGKDTFFAAARSNSTCDGTPLTQGAYRFGGSLAEISAPYECKALIRHGGDPNGYTFDRDYAGGGPVLPIFDFAGQLTVLQIYHGEWHEGTCANTVSCFYASLGMAISRDGGATFTKLGEIVQPTIPRLESIDSSRDLDVGGGTPVIADQDGRYIPDFTAIDPGNVYLYVFYIDKDPDVSPAGVCSRTACIALARARLYEVIAAALTGDTARFPTLFHKYYNGGFTQPATSGDPDAAKPSGHYTPILSVAGNYPTVVYDTRIHRYLLAYTTRNDGIVMHSGKDLLTWSDPIASGAISNPGGGLVYTTLIGEGGDPYLSHGDPRLVYVRAPKWPDWPGAVVVDRRVHVRPDR